MIDKDNFKEYIKSVSIYFDKQKIQHSDQSDRHRIGGNITSEEIALYLIIIGDFENTIKIAHLTLPFQESILAQISKHILSYEKEQEQKIYWPE